jgi:hypothetical protein
MAWTLGEIEGLSRDRVGEGVWAFDEDDFLLMAMLCDPVYSPELLLDDPANHDYAGCYRVYDYQYPLNRPSENPFRGYACARSVGKTESIKNKAQVHVFKRIGQNLLLTAPELIHLLPLTDAIEDRFNKVRLIREFLDVRGGKTGFTHRPFGVDFADGTKIIGRIPRLTGTGVKGQHQPDLIIDEAQDYPERGWVEVHETVMKDTVDRDGQPDFNYEFYGVHSGARDSGFFKRSNEGGFELVTVTAMQRPGWGKAEKDAAKAAYGGTSNPDYRRNILGEPGAASSAFFVTSRLIACVDQKRDSDYNAFEYVHQELRAEEFDELGLPIHEVLDLLGGKKSVFAGMDLGLTAAPTVISLFSHELVDKKMRLKLFRRYTLQRFRSTTIREACYAITFHHGKGLQAFGMDVTGLGLPIYQEMMDDARCPSRLAEVSRGYQFNAKVPIAVEETYVTKDQAGRMRDQFGAAVREEIDPLTNQTRYVTYMPMIESSTRYLAEMVDTGMLLLPFDTAITTDMQGETQQRVRAVGELKKKPNAFHILDSFRAMAQAFRADEIETVLDQNHQVPVLDVAV